MTDRNAEIASLAHKFHDTYERLAPDFGYATREASRVPWDDVDPNLRGLMEATVREVVGPLLRRSKRQGEILTAQSITNDVLNRRCQLAESRAHKAEQALARYQHLESWMRPEHNGREQSDG